MFYKFARLCDWLDEDDQWFHRIVLLSIGIAIMKATLSDAPLTDLYTWWYAFIFSACCAGIFMSIIGVFEMIEERYDRWTSGMTVIAVTLVFLLIVATEADACEDDLCTKRLNSYSHCIATSEYIYRCKVHKTAAEVACLSK